MEGNGRSILVAVEPVVLEGAIALLIDRRTDVDVVQFHASPRLERRHYDAAVVSSPPPEGMSADVVITLPAAGSGITSLATQGAVRWIVVKTHQDVIRLLEEHGAIGPPLAMGGGR